MDKKNCICSNTYIAKKQKQTEKKVQIKAEKPMSAVYYAKFDQQLPSTYVRFYVYKNMVSV